MINFFKNFGKGILYVFVLPFLLIGLAIYAVVAIFIFIYLAFKGLILFFTGRSLYEDLPEDIEAKKRLASANGAPIESSNTINSTIVEDNTVTNESTDPFYVPEYLKTENEFEEEPPIEEEQIQDNNISLERENDTQPSVPVSETPIQENKPEEVINIQKNPQNANILEISDLEDEEPDSGVDIEYK